MTGVEALGGLSAGDVGGMTHGLAGFVPADQAEVMVAIRIANDGERRVRITPADFSLVVDGTSAAPLGGTLSPAMLESGASLEARLSFVVPRTSAAASLRYADPRGPAQVLDLGAIATGPAPSPDPAHAH